MPCHERDFTFAELVAADEVFLTGSAAEIIGVREVVEHEDSARITKTHKISSGEGPITNKLRTKFRQIVTGDNIPED